MTLDLDVVINEFSLYGIKRVSGYDVAKVRHGEKILERVVGQLYTAHRAYVHKSTPLLLERQAALRGVWPLIY